MNRFLIILIAALVVLFVVVDGTLFTVDQTEQVLITQFGRPVRVITQPGLHAKIPFVQTVIPFDKRLLNVELPGEEVILSDQRRLIVDSFAVYRITDPLRYYQAVGTADYALQSRLNSIVTGSLRRVMGNNKLLDVLSADRERIMTFDPRRGEHRNAGLRRGDRGRAHPPRRPAAREHPGNPAAHAVGAAARRRAGRAPRAPRRP